MANILLKGDLIHSVGDLPKIGSAAPDFTLTKIDLSDTTLKDYAGQRIILNIFPSIDTPTCAASVRKFNFEASQLSNVHVLCVSMDLPFAQKRFCGAEGLEKVIPVSAFRHMEFGKNYGVSIVDGKLAGLLSRAVVILDEKGQVIYTEQVADIVNEPNYEKALAVLKS